MKADDVWRIAQPEFSLLGLIFFLDAARDGVNFKKASDSIIRSNQYEVLIPLPTAFVSLVESLGLLHAVCASGFDATLSMVDFKRTTEID